VLPRFEHVLVDGTTQDDAGVVKLSDELAVVFTTDFFTPVVDNPKDYGRIAAANSISDIYAMGAFPLCALNILGIPLGKVPNDVAAEIVQGSAEKCTEAGVAVIGGHSISNPEPVFGLAVVGTVHPDKILRNDGALPGLDIILTKPIGSGIITTGAMRDLATPDEVAGAVEWMTRLNKNACEAALKCDAMTATDITGFGLLGHLCEVAESSGITIKVYADRVPLMKGAHRLLEERAIPGGTVGNFQAVEGKARFPDDMHEIERLMLCDAQTSGGLVIAVTPDRTEELLRRLHDGGDELACVIGCTLERSKHTIIVR